jgi:2-C-methyl-D-erythritol 4-phosphate cytidylyltransferase
MNLVIIGAAGSGKRLGENRPKALVELARKPIFIHSLEIFDFPLIDGIVLVVPCNAQKDFSLLIKKFTFPSLRQKILAVVPGGRERQDSVFGALNYLDKNNFSKKDLVLVHNAANIFTKRLEIKKLLAVLKDGKTKGVALAMPSCDTLRELDSAMIPKKTLAREAVWRMQTPQGARLGDLLLAFESAKKEGYLGTDELELLIRAGFPTKIIKSNSLNFKITFPEDLKLAQAILDSGIFSYC